MPEFIHLHNHTHYSLLDGACTVDSLINAAVENNMPSVALTDHGNLFGALEFYKKALKHNIKPILGSELYIVVRGSRFDKEAIPSEKESGKKKRYQHLVLLVKNELGLKNLIKLSSIGYLEGFYYKPRIDLEVLRKHSEGLVALSACVAGVVASHLVNENMELAREDAIIFKEIFGDDFYLEIQNHNIDKEKRVMEGMPILSKELNLKLVATNDCHYIKKEHAIAHNILLLIPDSSANTQLKYKNLKYGTDQIYFKSQDEMYESFKDFPEALETTLEIAEKCNLKLELGINHMPDFPIPKEEGISNLDEYLEKLSRLGIKNKIKNITPEVEERLAFELKIIKQMGYSGYFLIVQDFINAAKERGISVGPGRGSAAGSLVSYALGITNLNPLDYDLLFERFLNPDRVSMPDIDIDFSDERRGEVIDYVREKYGANAVGQIITFGKLSTRAALKDVGRVIGVKLDIIDKINKQIPVVQGKVTPIKEAIETIPELKWVKDSDDPQIKELIEYAQVLENFNRNVSTHAAGVVIVPGNLVDHVPLYKTTSMTDSVTQYNMKDLETVGLLKMDFLGLKTLSILDNTLNLIEKNHGFRIDLDTIPMNDEKTFELFGKGQTVGVFQFESNGMQDYLKKLKPTCIDDLVAMNALYRPGPMDMIPDFIDRKQGKKKIEVLHPLMGKILKSTYGIIVYQEQVMQIANELAGYSLAGADLLRRAMGKKDKELMAKQRDEFILGASKNNVDKKIAGEVFDVIEKFASYGFNKSHSVAYSIIAYHTAYLKANYPTEFMTANLSNEIGDIDKIVLFIDDCRKQNIKVLPPDVNQSEVGFSCSNKEIRFGMEAIRNVGTNAVQEIVNARSKVGKFKDLFHFCESLDLRVANRKTLESLVLSGSMDSFGKNRRQMFDSVDRAIQYGQKRQEAELAGQENLFGISSQKNIEVDNNIYPSLASVEDWTQFERLSKEKSVLGFYISGHPLEKYRDEVLSFNNFELANTQEFMEGQTIKVLGIITDIRFKIDKKGKEMAFFTLEDFSGKGDCIAFSDAFAKFKSLIIIDSIVGVIGTGKSSGDKVSIWVKEVVPITNIKTNKSLVIKIFLEIINEKMVQDSRKLMESFPGSYPVIFKIINGSISNAITLKSNKIFVNPKNDLITELREMFGKENIEINDK